MTMQVCLFEDALYHNFKPLTLSRPIDDLRVGFLTLSQKWKQALEASSINRILRPEFKGLFKKGTIQPDHPCLWINSRYLPSERLLERIQDLSQGQCLRYKDTVVAALVSGEVSEQWHKKGTPDFNTLFVLETNNFYCIDHLWDLFLNNGAEISHDLERIELPTSDAFGRFGNSTFINEKQIFVHNSATIEAGCVLNAQEGPIYIGENATVMAGSMLRGPVAVGNGSTIKMGAKIYPKTTIGPICKVGGEVNNSIFHSYSNKAHDGFIGNSLIGQWCNLGADTNTSNLKNNYSPIRITQWTDEEQIDTGQQFLGTIMGDHSKTAINTQLNTGTLCGVSCNIFSTDFPPKFIPSFSWVGSNVIQTYKMEKAFRDMQMMMKRRDVEMTSEYKQMLKMIFDNRK